MSASDPIPAARGDEVWRLFVGLRLNPETRESLVRAQGRLRRAGVRVSWVKPENLHLTLAFLGDTFAARVPGLTAALDGAAGGVAPFDLAIAGLGAFGSPRSPRVIWAGAAPVPPGLTALHERVSAALRACGVPLETRPFAAHVTLGRVRSAHGAEALTSVLRSPMNPPPGGRLVVDRADLMRSELGPGGPVYTVLHESLLKE